MFRRWDPWGSSKQSVYNQRIASESDQTTACPRRQPHQTRKCRVWKSILPTRLAGGNSLNSLGWPYDLISSINSHRIYSLRPRHWRFRWNGRRTKAETPHPTPSPPLGQQLPTKKPSRPDRSFSSQMLTLAKPLRQIYLLVQWVLTPLCIIIQLSPGELPCQLTSCRLKQVSLAGCLVPL